MVTLCAILSQMPLPTDPDTLRVPAFMRRRSIRAASRRPLLLTALDRKQAGVLPEALQKKSQKKKKPQALRLKINSPKKSRSTRLSKKIEPKTEEFSAPLLDFYAETLTPGKILPPKTKAPKSIGEVTHYYDKIKVAVIKLNGTLCVGDLIRYELAEPTDEEDSYEQVVESMEIDREPVFKAGRGKEIGIKLRKMPRVFCKVLLVK